MKLKKKIATNWNELSKKQLALFAKLMLSNKPTKKTDVQLFFIVMNVHWCQFVKRSKLNKVLRFIKLEDIKQNYIWLYKACLRTTFIPLKNKVAPGDRLNNISIAEFSATEDLFQMYWETKNLDYIHYLAAVLYVPKESTYPTRPQFIKENIINLAKQLKTTKTQRLAIMLCYLGCKEHLAKKFPLVFPKPTSNQQLATNNQSTGLDPIILELSGHKFGTHKETKTTNLYVFLQEFNNKLKELQNAKSRH